MANDEVPIGDMGKAWEKDAFIAAARAMGWLDPDAADRIPIISLQTKEFGALTMGPRYVAMCIKPCCPDEVLFRETYWAQLGEQAGWWDPDAEEPLDLDIIGVRAVPEIEPHLHTQVIQRALQGGA